MKLLKDIDNNEWKTITTIAQLAGAYGEGALPVEKIIVELYKSLPNNMTIREFAEIEKSIGMILMDYSDRILRVLEMEYFSKEKT